MSYVLLLMSFGLFGWSDLWYNDVLYIHPTVAFCASLLAMGTSSFYAYYMEDRVDS